MRDMRGTRRALGAVVCLLVACGDDSSAAGGQGTGAGGAIVGAGGTSALGGGGAAQGGGGAAMGGAGGDGGAPPGEWSCLGTVTWPAPAAATADVTFELHDVIGDAPIVGATVRVCDEGDPACATPLDEAISNDAGTVSLGVPTPQPDGFRGLIEVTGAGVYPTLFVLRPPLFNDVPWTLGLRTTSRVATILTTIGATDDPARGHVLADIRDCDEVAAAGLALSSTLPDAQTTLAFGTSLGWSSQATATGDGGSELLANVPTGSDTMTAAFVPSGVPIGSYFVPVRAGTLTRLVAVRSP